MKKNRCGACYNFRVKELDGLDISMNHDYHVKTIADTTLSIEERCKKIGDYISLSDEYYCDCYKIGKTKERKIDNLRSWYFPFKNTKCKNFDEC